jgi:hypothetical protein
MIYRLIFLSGPLKGQRLTVTQEPMVFGRDPACTVCLQDDEDVAARHAMIVHSVEGLLIRDLGTMNRILLNHREIKQARIKHGDEVEIGRTQFMVQAQVEADVDQPYSAGRRKEILHDLLIGGGVLLVAGGVLLWRWALRVEVGPPPPPPARHARQQPQPASNAIAAQATSPATAATGALSAVVAPSNLPTTGEDILSIRQDLSRLRETVQQMATQTPVAATAPATAAPPARPLPPVAVLTPPAPAPVPAPGPETVTVAAVVQAPARPPALRIESVDQSRFPDSAEADEMRLLTVTLAPLPETQGVRPEDVRIDVHFFDQDAATAAPPHRSRAVAPRGPLPLQGAWPTGQAKTFTAAYAVPRGFRAREAAAGRRDQYAGYVVRLYYRGELLATEARPRTLLEALFTPDAGPVRDGSATNPPRAEDH